MKKKEIFMFKDGEYVLWDGSDVKGLMIKETITLRDFKKYFPKEYKKFCSPHPKKELACASKEVGG